MGDLAPIPFEEALRAVQNAPDPFEYIPHAKQIEWHSSTALERGIFAGNRIGKSDFLANEFRFWAEGRSPYRNDIPAPPNNLRLGVEDFDVGLAIMLPKFEEYCRPQTLHGGSWASAYSKGEHVLHWANGSELKFLSFHQAALGRGAQKAAGVEIALYGHDEHGPRELWEESMVRLGAGRQATHGIVTYTPKLGITWEHDVLYERWQKDTPDVECFTGSIWDNTYLRPEQIKRILDRIYDPVTGIGDKDLRQVTEFGTWMHLSGMVYPMWNTIINLVPYSEARVKASTKFVWIDPHPRRPAAVNWFGVDQNEAMFTYREGDFAGSPARVWEQIKGLSAENGEDIRHFGIDCHWDFKQEGAGVEDGKSIQRQYEEASGAHFIKSPAIPGSKWAGIVMLRSALEGSPTLDVSMFSVMASCPQTARQFERWRFKPQTVAAREGDRHATIDEDNDHVELCRYFVQSKPRFEGLVRRKASVVSPPNQLTSPSMRSHARSQHDGSVAG